MDIEIKLKGAFDRALRTGISASLMLLAASGLQAAALWSNGVVNTTYAGDVRCDSGAATCASANPWTIFDNFNIPAASKAWVVSSFDFTDFLVGGPTTDYKSTTWSIWNGDPLAGGKLVASGTALSGSGASISGVNTTCSGIGCILATITVNLSSPVALASGNTYYLGTSNAITANPNETTFRAYSSGGNSAPGGTANSLVRWEQSNGTTTGIAGSTWAAGNQDRTFVGDGTVLGNFETATAFDINGTLAPEPGTWMLLSVALGGLALVLRRRTA